MLKIIAKIALFLLSPTFEDYAQEIVNEYKAQGKPAWFTKTRQERTVYIPDELVNTFIKLHESRISDFVFPSRVDPNRPQTLNKSAWLKMRKASGVVFSPYSLRHYSATKKARAGIERKLIANDMGTSVRMLDKHYDHVNLEDRKLVANAIKLPTE